MAAKKWKIAPRKSEDLIAQLLLNRGLKIKKEINQFFDPKIENFKKDLKIPGIHKAQKRIKDAIKNNELIVIFGDYDVDGICASAILYQALTSIGAKVLPYIPHREKEGYGLSEIGLDFAKNNNASLVITVDNGIVAIKASKYAKKIGLDLIITDHHIPGSKLPKAFAIVHSLNMCGAGVAWCLIKDLVPQELEVSLLQFVSIATISDLIPLTNINRAFVKIGLEQLNKTDNIGLKSLIYESGLTLGSLGTYELGYIIGPRLNAIGRLEHAIDALRLLCTKDPIKARKLARLLSETNTKRQQLTEIAINEARIMLIENGNKKIHVLSSKAWVPGIIGLIAARVCEESLRPAIAISVGETHSKGSARSVNGINIVEVIRKCSDILVDVGGHRGAAGFTILNEHLEVFKSRLEKEIRGQEGEVESILEVEAEVETKNLTKKLAGEIEKFAPFGIGNPQPLLATKNMQISDIRTLKDGKHLKFKVNPSVILGSSAPPESIDCIAFGKGSLKEVLTQGQFVDLAFYLEINKFNGSEILQLRVKDIKSMNQEA